MPPFDIRKLSKTSSFVIATCGCCPNAHIILYSEEGRPFAQFIIDADQAADILTATKEIAAQFHQNQKDHSHDPKPKHSPDDLTSDRRLARLFGRRGGGSGWPQS